MNDDVGANATVPDREICLSAIVGEYVSLAMRLTAEKNEEGQRSADHVPVNNRKAGEVPIVGATCRYSSVGQARYVTH